MGLNDVKQDILNDAKQEAQQITAEAEEQKDSIIEDAEAKAADIIEDAEQEAQQEAEALRKKEISSARMKAKKMRLNAQEAVLENVFDAFREQVDEIDESEEADLIESVLENLSDNIDIGTVTVSSAHTDLVDEYGEVEEDDINGVIVTSADGAKRFDMRFEKVTDQIIRDNRKAVSEVLFE